MDIATALQEEAMRCATYAQRNLADLESILEEIERQKAEVEAKRETARLAPKRLLNYEFKIGTEYQCPRCWIRNETRTALRPVSSGSDNYDIFRCGACDGEFVIPAR